MTASENVAVREQDVVMPDGRRLHIYESGDPHGELIIYHHGTPGAGTPAGSWTGTAMERGIRLVGYDRPGYGGSDRHAGRRVADAAYDVATIADSLGVGRFRTWGASGGGPHTLACAALLGDRVVAAVAVASIAPFDAPGLDWTAGMGQDNIDEFGAAIAGADELTSYLSAARAQLSSAPIEQFVEGFRSLLPDVDVAAMDDDVSAYLESGFTIGLRSIDGWFDDDVAFTRDWGFDVHAIRVPVKVMHGVHDLMVPFAHGNWLAAAIPGATAELSDSDGHISLISAIDRVHTWLLDQG